MPRANGPDGKYTKQRALWTPDNWDDGYMDNRGRFRVYRPDYPRSYAEGYALRAHVHWWLFYGEVHPTGTNLHHMNGTKHDDRIQNLAMVKHGQHSSSHNRGVTMVEIICDGCGQRFQRAIGRINSKDRKSYNGRFCSQACYHRTPRRLDHKRMISEGLKRAYMRGARR